MRVKYGSIITDGSGKLGGHVASKGRSGSVIRTKVTGTNPRTTAQNSTRALLGSLAAGWSSLTEEQRQSFDSAVDKFKSTDIFGDVHNPSGYNLYIKLNFNLISSGAAPITSAPDTAEQNNSIADSANLYDAFPEAMFIFLNVGNDSLYKYQVKASIGVSPGVYNGKSLLSVIYYDYEYGTLINWGYAYIAKFGNPVVGTKVFFSVAQIYSNGQKGVESFGSCIVVQS